MTIDMIALAKEVGAAGLADTIMFERHELKLFVERLEAEIRKEFEAREPYGMSDSETIGILRSPIRPRYRNRESQKMTVQHITQDELKRLLDYDFHTGIFTWKDGEHRNNPSKGKIAGRKNISGCIEIKILGRIYKAHRLAWLWAYGDIPNFLDHINRNSTDNRICNLRPTNHSQNRMNSGPSKNNKIGLKGVCKKQGSNRFTAQIKVNGKNRHIGYFSNAEDAHAAYMKEAGNIFGEFVPLHNDSVNSLIGEKK